jgi:DNA replication regulator DPB11
VRVTPLAFSACLIETWRRLGRFEETSYLVTQARPERRQPPSLSHIPNNETPEPSQRHVQQDPDEPEEEEIAVARRVPAATLRVWESLLAPRGYTKLGSKLVKTTPADAPKLTPHNPPHLPGGNKSKGKSRELVPMNPLTAAKGRSALGTFTRSKSFAPGVVPQEEPCASTSRQPFRKARSLFLPQPTSPSQVAPGPDGSAPQIFAGMRFRARAEARSTSVRSAIEDSGGTWVEDEDEDEHLDFVIVRLVRYSPSRLDF